MTPIVKLRWARRERAKKFGRYLYFRTAAKMRSLVSWGMESATGERLMTSETVAGESPRRSASSFRLTGLGPMRTVRPAPLRLLFFRHAAQSRTNQMRRSKQLLEHRAQNSDAILIDIARKNVFHTLRKRSTNPI